MIRYVFGINPDKTTNRTIYGGKLTVNARIYRGAPGGSTTVMMQAKYAHDGTYSYMGLAPLSASTSDTVWTVRRLEFNTEGELTEDLSATGAWDNYDSLTYT